MDAAQTAVALRPIATGDLEFLEREVVDRDVRGHANWWGFGNAGSVRRQFETDGFLGQDGGRLIAEVDGQPIGGINREEYGAFESMADRKNFRQHWQSLFRTVLFVSTKQNDVFAFTRTFASIIDHPIGRVRCSDKKDHQNSNRTRKESGEIHWGSFIPVSLKDSNEKAVSDRDLGAS